MLGQRPVERSTRPALDAATHGSAVVLRLSGVTRAHGSRTVWAPVDLSLAPSTMSVVTGPNGAGKTTLLRLAAGLLRPSTGRRECAGRALYVRGGGGLRGVQTVTSAVEVTAGLVGRRQASDAALRLLGMEPLASRRVGTLSAGERVRAALAAAVACAPAVLCLDEPTAALDQQGLRDLGAVLDAVRTSGTALLVATHQPGPLLATADAHILVDEGSVRLL